MPLIETTNTAESGLAILFAAIDYRQSSNQASFSPTCINPPKRALNPAKRGAQADFNGISEGNLPIKKRKINRRSWERSNFKMNKKATTDEFALPAPLSYSVPSSPNSVHTAIVSVSSSDGPDHDDSSSIESSLTAPDELVILDDVSAKSAAVEAYQMTIGNATTCQATSEQTMPTLPIISFDPDQLAALLEQQQQRLYASIQKTEHSRALLHGMSGTSSFES